MRRLLGQLAGLDMGLKTRRVHLGGSRGVDGVDTSCSTGLEVAVDRTRVPVEIGRLVELERIHEDRHDDPIAAFADRVDERQMAAVQRPHRRHDADAFALDTSGSGPLAHRRG